MKPISPSATAGRSTKAIWLKSLTLNLGGIYYAYDTTLYPQGDSFELYYGLAADFKYLKLSRQGNSEVSHYPGTWLTVGISRVFELPYYKMTLELGNNLRLPVFPGLRRVSEHAFFQSGQRQSLFRSSGRAGVCHPHHSGAPVRLYSP